jgi:BirA family transcriptional regulator, biotin operon repressor / biotin---[acetyl-CoA-carboxylase] ligase
MDFPLSAQIASNLEYLAETGSTNADLVARAPNAADFSVLVAGYQSAGKGRAGRTWLAPAGSSLFVSILLKPADIDPAKYSFLPLLAGLAMTQCVSKFLPDAEVSLKWPNDVLVGENKIAGVLSELLHSQDGVVIGAGLNIKQQQSDLPISNATSMALAGGKELDLDRILASYLSNFKSHYQAWLEHQGNSESSGVLAQVVASCSTIGRDSNWVRVMLPGDKEFIGEATGIDSSGRLIVNRAESSDEKVVAVAAGDIIHLRHN